MHTISVVIPAYNEEKTIGKCLASLVKQETTQVFEVILVDNNSTDRTIEKAAKYKGTLDLKIIEEPRKGRGSARHRGFEEAKGAIILSTDADTLVPPDWIESMTEYFQDPEIVGITGSWKINDCSLVKNTVFNMIGTPVVTMHSLIAGYTVLAGSNFAIRRDAYRQAGGFRVTMNGMEDVELSSRVSRIGKIKYDDRIAVLSSGRRFKNGMTRGFLMYGKNYMEYFLLKKGKGFLSDVR